VPGCGSAPLAELLEGSAVAKCSVLEVSRDWAVLDTASVKGLQHFESHLTGFRERVEAEMAWLMAGAQELTQQPGWWQRERDVGTLNAALDLTHWWAGLGVHWAGSSGWLCVPAGGNRRVPEHACPARSGCSSREAGLTPCLNPPVLEAVTAPAPLCRLPSPPLPPPPPGTF
jgi:hypothetical protein